VWNVQEFSAKRGFKRLKYPSALAMHSMSIERVKYLSKLISSLLQIGGCLLRCRAGIAVFLPASRSGIFRAWSTLKPFCFVWMRSSGISRSFRRFKTSWSASSEEISLLLGENVVDVLAD